MATKTKLLLEILYNAKGDKKKRKIHKFSACEYNMGFGPVGVHIVYVCVSS